MGKDLAERFPDARRVFEAIDSALGVGLSKIMFEGPEEELTATQNAQPAILAHSAAVFAIVSTKVGAAATAAGHSLGEYSAYYTAGALDAAEAAKLVRRRGELMQKAGEQRPGTMAAILGLTIKDVEAACEEASQQASVAVAANINAPDQIVISGDPDAVARAGDVCKKRGAKRVLPLKVSGAFHSPAMGAAAPELAAALDEVELGEPSTTVYTSVTAAPFEDVRRQLVEGLTSPVRWRETVLAIRMQGETRYLEVGPGKVLAGLVRRILDDVDATSLQEAARA